jgi:hypothetical protein
MKKFIFNQYVETLVLANLLLISYEKFFNHMKIGENYVVFINYIKFNIIAFLATVIITILDEKFKFSDNEKLKNILYFVSYAIFGLVLIFSTIV